MTDKPKHSPLGASGAERWMNCPGSYTLLNTLKLPTTDEKDFQKEGTAAHEALAFLLMRPDMDAWEIVGDKHNDVEVTPEMADALQVFIDRDRADLKTMPAGAKTFIEYGIDHPDHPLFYGTLDRALVWPEQKRVKIRDFKYGQGVVVEVEENPQLLYYAYGLLKDFVTRDDCEGWAVELEIVQPRIDWHPDGPVRSWTIDAQYVLDWGDSTLLPAMQAAQIELNFDAGKWCRFCPAKLVCPLMQSLFGAAMKSDPRDIKELTLDEVANAYQYTQAVEQYINALKEEAYRRLFAGEAHDAIKLVPKKANRVLKPEAEAVFKEKFGEEAYTKPKLKSAAELEKIDSEAKKLVKEYAYTPLTGLTVALASDKRPGVKVETTIQAFPNALDFAKEEA